jgi:hypothetical protein
LPPIQTHSPLCANKQADDAKTLAAMARYAACLRRMLEADRTAGTKEAAGNPDIINGSLPAPERVPTFGFPGPIGGLIPSNCLKQ